MAKYIKINGVSFELHKDKYPIYKETTGYVWDEIKYVYARPSDIKVKIWHDWCNWCQQLLDKGIACGIRISGHNYMQFSIYGTVEIDGTLYSLWITRDHNRAYIN